MRVGVECAQLRRVAPRALRRRRFERQALLGARYEAAARLLLVDDLLQQLREVRDGADARIRARRPARR
eukprot:3727730-Prymnesium_polylepis.1